MMKLLEPLEQKSEMCSLQSMLDAGYRMLDEVFMDRTDVMPDQNLEKINK